MRLLACFSRNRVVLDKSDPLARVNNKEHRNDPKFDRATKPVPDPNVFVPTSIPELHPEYAHSEPYCFSARTDSARLIVEKIRDAKGQPAPDRAEILKEQGIVVVRGPSYNARKAAQEAAARAANNNPSVPLAVETPSTADESFAESDDSGPDENLNDENNTMSRNSIVSQTTKSPDSKAIVAQSSKHQNTKSKKIPAKPFRLISRKSKNSLKPTNSPNNVLQPRDSNVEDDDEHLIHHRSSFPTPPSSDHSSESPEEQLQKHMDNTPKELLAPIMVPRMSAAFSDSNNITTQDHKRQVRPVAESPAISNDSWGPTDTSKRYDDVEGDSSSGLVTMSAVGKEKVIHKATYSPARARARGPKFSSKGITPVLQDTSSQSTASHSMRSRRKSKPYLSTSGTIETSVPIPNSPEDPPIPQDRLDDILHRESGSVPEPSALSREISIGVMSDDIQVVDTPAVSPSGNSLVPLPTPSPKEAARQRIKDDYIDLPNANAQPQGIVRRASSTKRKTVSFHTASPTIIEPNLRAPSSVPRSALLSRENSEAPKKPVSALRNARDSVALASSPVPRTIDSSTYGGDVRQDSFTSDDTFQERSARRMSTRVMVKDRNELREASKRQSKAVAAAMADQLRGVPKSAMLAFSENEIELAHSFEESEQDSSLSSLRRRSRVSKSIRVPDVVPGVVPPPPPPPPFVPDMPRARSIRTPPPPPASPLRY